MRLYLVRHGRAHAEMVDPKRPLTDIGVVESQQVADSLKRAGANVDLILHSDKTRAKQTAQIMQKTLKSDCAIEQRDNIAPNDPVDPIFQEIKKYRRDVMIVSHLPLLPKLTSRLMTGSEHPTVVYFVESTVAILEQCPHSHWRMDAMLTPDLL